MRQFFGRLFLRIAARLLAGDSAAAVDPTDPTDYLPTLAELRLAHAVVVCHLHGLPLSFAEEFAARAIPPSAVEQACRVSIGRVQ